MTPSSLSESSKPDLRSPAFTRLRKGVGMGWLRVLTLVLMDSVALSLAWQIAEMYGTQLESPWSLQSNPFSLLIILAVGLGLFATRGLYKAGDSRRNYLGLVKALTLSQTLLLLTAFLYQPGYFISRSTFILSWLLSILFVCLGRLTVDVAIERFRKQGTGCHPIYLICHPEDAEKATYLLEQENRYTLLGWLDVCSLDTGNWEDTLEKIRLSGVSEVFLCSWSAVKNKMFLHWSLRNAGITLHILPISLGTMKPLFRKTEFWMIGGLPSITFSPPLITGSDFWLKRSFDFCCAALLLLIASPVYILIAVLIKFDSPGPIFYKQVRIGLHGRRFKVWKFRTMVVNAEQLQKELEALNEMKDGVLFKMKDDPRITRVGRFLRRYSLDELPQIFNVLLGQMSLVGPRPLPVRDTEKFAEHHFIRHEVLPGITGLWQVSGRSDIDNFEDVVNLDVTYIENWSIWLDLRILLQTVRVVLHKTGAY